MGLNDKASDWQVAGIAQVGGAAGLGAGVWWFEFFSQAVNTREPFMFIGAGIGAGGSIGGASAPDLTDLGNAKPAYSQLACARPFSVSDLDMSIGRLTSAGAGIGPGYGLLYISGLNTDGALFSSQSVSGWTIGVGATAIAVIGYWRSTTIAGAEANNSAREYITRSSN